MIQFNSAGGYGRFVLTAMFASVSVLAGIPVASSAESSSLPGAIVGQLGIKGGFAVQVGGDESLVAKELGATGRFLVQIFDRDPAVVAGIRQRLSEQNAYGLVSGDLLPAAGSLPLTENVANLVVLAPGAGEPLPAAEWFRVLCPHGVLVAEAGRVSEDVLKAAGFEVTGQLAGVDGWLAARKPWPAEMDQWPEPRHAADGNAVSRDTLVGPPRRIRWVAGPSQEVSSLVSGAGRNYYGGVWTRDAFNGLRLWQRDLKPSPAQGGFGFQRVPGSVRPIAFGDQLLVFADGVMTALDGTTGEPIRQYPEAGQPTDAMFVAHTLLAVDAGSIRAVDSESGKLLWNYQASEPRYVVAGDDAVFLLEGAVRRGEPVSATCLELSSGGVRWKRTGEAWLPLVRRSVCDQGLLVLEVSTWNDDKEGNAIHVWSAADGRELWSRVYVPGMQHMKQARAMFADGLLWILEHLKCVGLDPLTGEVKRSWQAGFCHCFPPVATSKYFLAGEMELTDLASGQYDANRISKAACGRDAGWVPANGLIYVTPKHCVCWPMLRGYSALAPEHPSATVKQDLSPGDFVPETEVAPPAPASLAAAADDWPCYRHDPWRTQRHDGRGALGAARALDRRNRRLAVGHDRRRLARESVRAWSGDGAGGRRWLGVRRSQRRARGGRLGHPDRPAALARIRPTAGSTRRRRSIAASVCSAPRAAGCTRCGPTTGGWCGGFERPRTSSGLWRTARSNRRGRCRAASWPSTTRSTLRRAASRWPTAASSRLPRTAPAARCAGSSG